jgi:hypothetical protein
MTLKDILRQTNMKDFFTQVRVSIEGIPGFRYVFMRILSNLLLFVALILCYDGILDTSLARHLPGWLILCPILGVFPFYYMHLSQRDYIDDHRRAFLMLGLALSVGIQLLLIWAVGADWSLFWTFYLPLSIALIGLIMGRHFIMTIYRNLIIYYVVCMATFIGIWLPLMLPWMGITAWYPVLYTFIAMFLQFYGTYRLIQKKLMHFI